MYQPKATIKSGHNNEEENQNVYALEYPPTARAIYGIKIEPWN
jgi:hypothetical protein